MSDRGGISDGAGGRAEPCWDSRRSVSYNVHATRNVLFENVVIESNHFHRGCHTTGVGIVGINGSCTTDERDTYRSETGWDAASPVPQPPEFVDGPAGDYHLAPGGPAIGAGKVIPGITTDFDGDPRSDAHPAPGADACCADEVFCDGFGSGDTGAWSAP